MDKTLEQLMSLMDSGNVEQRCAALTVLGALKIDNAAIAKSVGKFLDDANPIVKDYALRYFEQVQPKNNVAQLIKHLDDSDRDVQERAVQSLSVAGTGIVAPLGDAVVDASRVWQMNAARVLCAVRGKPALRLLLRMLTGGSDETNRVICDHLTPVIREMSAKDQESFYADVEALAGKLEIKEQRPAAVSVMRLLGQLGRPQARRWLLKHIGPDQHPTLRSHALVALLRCLRDQTLHKDEFAKLFAILDEVDYGEATRLTLDLLDAHELPGDSRALLNRLMQSPHNDVQKFALRKMGDVATPATVRTLIEQLGDSDYRKRDVAASSLRKIPEARATLLKELAACDDASKAWSIAELLPSFEGSWRQDTLRALSDRLQKAIAIEDRIQTAFLHVLRNADAEFVYDQLAAQALKLVKAKKYKEAASFLTPLKEFAEFKDEDRYRLALCQLKLHPHTVASHRNHPAVELLTELCRRSSFSVFDALRKEKQLEPDTLFALGFSLTERTGQERDLGVDLLGHIAKKFPRNKIGKNAKNKLKLVGA